eukprot:6179603-Pleurochrysis_carterae.AAC.2
MGYYGVKSLTLFDSQNDEISIACAYRSFQQSCSLLAAEPQALSHATATYVKRALLPHWVT